MTAEQINAKALEFLSSQDFENAERLLYENVKANPSYQTYGNLGHFFVSVGFARNDKRAGKGFKLGYHLYSSNISSTAISMRSS